MSIVNNNQYVLDCWQDPDREDVETVMEYSEDLTALRAKAEAYIASGRYKYLALSRWDVRKRVWVLIEVFE